MPVDPLNVAATAIFCTGHRSYLLTARVMRVAHHVNGAMTSASRCRQQPHTSILANGLHFIGEVELVFGLWVIPLILVFVSYRGWETPRRYINDTVNYTEPIFVVVIMVLASTSPIIDLGRKRARTDCHAGRPHAGGVVVRPS